MTFRKLGKNGPELSAMGLGTWVFGGPWRYGWGQVDDRESIATLRLAVELGINWIDTAPVYGLGHAEQVVARALRNKRSQVLISTKCGLVWQKEIKKRPHNLTPENIRRECEESLVRLKTDHLDLFQFHAPDPETPIEESWPVMTTLKKEGKVRWIGLSNFSLKQIQACQKLGAVDFIQPRYNLLDRQIEAELLPFCKEENIGVITYSPLASGLLSGSFDPARLTMDDWRRKDPAFQLPALGKKKKIIKQLLQCAKALEISLPQLSIAFVLAQPFICSAIMGSRNRDQLIHNIKSGRIAFPGTLLDRIKKLTAKQTEQQANPEVS